MGCRNFAVGCGIFALITVAALGIGGFWLYQQFGPTVQAYIAFGQKVESTLNGISDVSTNLNSNNGKNTFVIGARVPFDPNDLQQAEHCHYLKMPKFRISRSNCTVMRMVGNQNTPSSLI
jgi:hypothetical protein